MQGAGRLCNRKDARPLWRIIRVDLDLDFFSADDLRRRLVDLGLGGCLPHYVTWDDHGDGVVRHPHVG